MTDLAYEFVSIDLPALLAGTLACLSCALLGNYLVLRRMSLMGDAISHSVLPGLVIAFMLTGTRAPVPMFLGAAAAGLLTVGIVELLRRYARIEPGAAMGVAFSVLFATGVLLLERGAGRQVDLDADCVLNGVLETMLWFPPREPGALTQWSTWAQLPRQVWTLIYVLLATLAFISLLFKELRIVCFDPGLATSQGFPAGPIRTALMIMVACATVASFEAVGSILVIAMLICPPAAARMLTDRLLVQVLLSGAIAATCGIGGYLAAAFLPARIGLDSAVSAAGMMTVMSGAALLAAMLLSPSHGVLARRIRRARLSLRVHREDLLATLYRAEEQRTVPAPARPGVATTIALRRARLRGQVVLGPSGPALTDRGREQARSIVRAHRLWEAYLVERGGLAPDHVHPTATTLEHLTDPVAGTRLEPPEPPTARDPHDRPIPPPASHS